jgi:hypothetical protein
MWNTMISEQTWRKIVIIIEIHKNGITLENSCTIELSATCMNMKHHSLAHTHNSDCRARTAKSYNTKDPSQPTQHYSQHVHPHAIPKDYFPNIHLNKILPTSFWSSKQSFSNRFHKSNSVITSCFIPPTYIFNPSWSPKYQYPKSITQSTCVIY